MAAQKLNVSIAQRRLPLGHVVPVQHDFNVLVLHACPPVGGLDVLQCQGHGRGACLHQAKAEQEENFGLKPRQDE